MTFKQRIYKLLDDKRNSVSKSNKYFEIFITTLVFLSILEIILESYNNIAIKYVSEFRIFELFTVFIFTAEYLLRLWTADMKYPKLNKFSSRLKFATSPMGLVDLVAILPFYLPLLFKLDLRFIRILRVLRLLRIFKLHRYSKALNLLGGIFEEKRTELFITLFLNVILLLVASTIMYNLENTVQPDKFPNIVETFWWAIATLTTVGYGDVYPVTALGKLVSGIIAILGIGLVALPTGIISAGFVEKIQEEKQRERLDFKYCPHCGEEINHYEKH